MKIKKLGNSSNHIRNCIRYNRTFIEFKIQFLFSDRISPFRLPKIVNTHVEIQFLNVAVFFFDFNAKIPLKSYNSSFHSISFKKGEFCNS